MFIKYPHLERYGNEEVDGIEQGISYVFPKLDGTNAQVWMNESGQVCAGSRNRALTLDNDNAGFYNHIVKDERIEDFLLGFPDLNIYGEWLVPHSLKTYREDAWHKFYIFDLYNRHYGYWYDYDRMADLLDVYGLNYLPTISIIRNGNREHYEKCLTENKFLIQDGMGVGEGIVIKNYNWTNKFGNITWAKIVTNEFKEIHHREMGAPIIGGQTIEEKMVDELVTQHFVDKVVAKIRLGNLDSVFAKSDIPRLLQTVFYDLVNEETWNFLKKNKNPRIDFAFLNRLTISKVKELRKDIF